MSTKVYLAGPMHGFPDFNFPAFRSACELLRAKGFQVFNPAERDEALGFDPSGMAGTSDELTRANFDVRDALLADLTWLTLHADAVAVLPGWTKSSGAIAEVALARKLGLQVFKADSTMAPVTHLIKAV